MQIHKYPTLEEAKKNASEKISSILLTHTGKKKLFLCSGGSALSILPETIAGLDYENLTISVLDERYSTDPEINNFLKLKETTFYKNAVLEGASSIDALPSEDMNLEKFSLWFAESLVSWKTVNPYGVVIVTLGMGEDGHTAGILPMPEDPTMFETLFEDPMFWVKGVNVGNKSKYSERVTVTNIFLKEKVDNAIAFTVGAEKTTAYGKLLDSSGSIPEVPARIWHKMKSLDLYTDINL